MVNNFFDMLVSIDNFKLYVWMCQIKNAKNFIRESWSNSINVLEIE